MTDLYLRTTDEQELIDSLSFARGVDEDDDGIWITGSHNYSLDIIGNLYNDDGVFDSNGEVITPATKLSGFHANLCCTEAIADLVPAAIQVTPKPNKLKRVWA